LEHAVNRYLFWNILFGNTDVLDQESKALLTHIATCLSHYIFTYTITY
jgi:hypothetical protein